MRRTAALVGWAVSIAVWVAVAGVPVEREQVLLICLSGVAALSVGQKGAISRLFRDWLPIVVVLVLYDLSRGAAADLGRPVQVSSIANAERLLSEQTPTEWLQHRLARTPAGWAIAASLIYVSHFMAIFAVGAWLWQRDRGAWTRWRSRFLTVTLAALTVFVVLPVAPPWVAGRLGVIGPVRRTASDGWAHLDLSFAGEWIADGQWSVNLYAAFPSLHTAYAVLVASTLWSYLRPPERVLAAAYPIAMGFVLVSSGEHYVLDVVAGAALVGVAGAVWRWREGRPRPPSASRVSPSMLRPWVVPVIGAVLLATAVRAVRLRLPSVLVHDEAFYVSDAVDMAVSGRAPFALHPPAGKWPIAASVGMFGVNPLAWRIPMLAAGVAVVALAAGAVWSATRDRRATAVAGVLVALDGLAVVSSRLALLEAVASLALATMVLGVVAVHADRGWASTGRCRWAPGVAVAGAGLAVATKWSLAPVALVAGLAVVAGARQRGRQLPVTLVCLACCAAVYVAAWVPASVGAGAAVRDSWRMASEHFALDRVGPGHASAATWLFQSAPTTLFAKECIGVASRTDGVCPPGVIGSARVVAQGSPILWAAGGVVVLGTLFAAVRARSSAPITAGAWVAGLVLAAWVPWFAPGASPYSFHGAVVVPALAVSVGLWVSSARRRTWLSTGLLVSSALWFVAVYPSLVAIPS